MIRILGKSIAFCCFHGPVITHDRRDNARRPSVEILEGRIALSNVVHDPAYVESYEQPLNGDTSYSITGTIGTNYTEQNYAFYASKGNRISVSAAVISDTVFDGMLIAFGPLNDVHENDDFNDEKINFTALSSGVYVVRIENYFSTVDTVSYDLNISGSDKPKITVTSPSSTTTAPNTFYISAKPSMPQVQITLTGIVPDDRFGTKFTWATSVSYDPSKTIHGPHNIISYKYPLQYTSMPSLTPDFGKVIRGGTLSVSVMATIDGFSFSLSNKQVSIGGTNPTLSAALTYVDSITKSAYDTVLRQLVVHESNGHGQFNAPYGQTSLNPIFSSDNRGGVGFMQITNPAPTDEQVWDWKADIQAGVALFNQKLSVASGYPDQVEASASFQKLISVYNNIRRSQKKPVLDITVPEFTQDELARDAIRGYNGYGGAGDGFGHPQHEFRVELDASGNLVVDQTGPTTGEIIWQEVPISARKNTPVPDYVNIVLKTSPNG